MDGVASRSEAEAIGGEDDGSERRRAVSLDTAALSEALALQRDEMMVTARRETQGMRESILQEQKTITTRQHEETLREAKAAFEQRLKEESSKIQELTARLEQFMASGAPNGNETLTLRAPPLPSGW